MKLWNSRRSHQEEFYRTAILRLWSKTQACGTPVCRAPFDGRFLADLILIPIFHTED